MISAFGFQSTVTWKITLSILPTYNYWFMFSFLAPVICLEQLILFYWKNAGEMVSLVEILDSNYVGPDNRKSMTIRVRNVN